MSEQKKLTDFQEKTLRIIEKFPNIHGRELSKFLWPESEAHKRLYKGGYGTATGKGAWLAAGSQVGKLIKLGLVKDGHDYRGNRDGYKITAAGKKMLDEVTK